MDSSRWQFGTPNSVIEEFSRKLEQIRVRIGTVKLRFRLESVAAPFPISNFSFDLFLVLIPVFSW